MNNKISLAGDLGSGKSTVASILVEAIGAEYYSTGAIVRSIAAKHGMTVVELNLYMETHPEIDNEIDDGLVALSDDPRSLIIDSRMAWHFTRGTFKLYLSTDPEVSALRIMGANRIGEHEETLEETVKKTRARRASERKRYFEQYGVDIKDLRNYAVIVDTTYATPDEVAECILNAYRMWQEDEGFRRVYISPERLHYPDREPNAELLTALSAKLELGEETDMPEVFENDGEFYLKSGLEAALAHSFNMSRYIPAILTDGECRGEYVRMKDSL